MPTTTLSAASDILHAIIASIQTSIGLHKSNLTAMYIYFRHYPSSTHGFTIKTMKPSHFRDLHLPVLLLPHGRPPGSVNPHQLRTAYFSSSQHYCLPQTPVLLITVPSDIFSVPITTSTLPVLLPPTLSPKLLTF